MTCERWMEAISARADGEDPGVDPRLLDHHLRRCPSCAAFEADVVASRVRVRVGSAAPQPDLSRHVVKLNAIADRAARWGVVRALLAVVAVQIVVLAAPGLFLGSETGATTHHARHLGAFGVAYAVGLLMVAVRPARARTMLPVATVLAVTIVVTAVIDVVDGATGPIGELLHLPELLSVVLVWALARPAPQRSSSPTAAQVLRPVAGEQPPDARAAR